jgi:epoxyqueuosine reductase
VKPEGNLIENEIKARAKSLGFQLCGITSAAPPQEYFRYERWVENDDHAEMNYLASPYHMETRRQPERLFPGLQSIIVLGSMYALPSPSTLQQKNMGVLSGYMTGEDYHQSIPTRLEPLVVFLESLSPATRRPRIFTDSSPILERELGSRAGLGWIGRNSCLISPLIGSGFLLAEIFTDLPLLPDPPFLADRCGSCQRCVNACPTQCILPDRTIDSSRCISYLTIENRGAIPSWADQKISHQLAGCDICQVVCPWNQRSLRNQSFPQENQFDLEEMLKLIGITAEDFTTRFANRAVSRVKRSGLVRNLTILLKHSGDQRASQVARDLLLTEKDPLVRNYLEVLLAENDQ